MSPIYLSIQPQATGSRIKSLLIENGYSVKDIQNVMGFENPQAVYKWLQGKSLPSVDNLLILSKVLHTTMEDILVFDEDIFMYSCCETMRNPNITLLMFCTSSKDKRRDNKEKNYGKRIRFLLGKLPRPDQNEYIQVTNCIF